MELVVEKDSFLGDLLEELEICHCIPEFGYGSVAGLWFTNEGGVWVEDFGVKR